MSPADPRDAAEAAERGADLERPLDDEPALEHASLQEATIWVDAYRQLASLEEQLQTTIDEHLRKMSDAARREVELTNVPLIESQAARFRLRLRLWEERRRQLSAEGRSDTDD